MGVRKELVDLTLVLAVEEADQEAEATGKNEHVRAVSAGQVSDEAHAKKNSCKSVLVPGCLMRYHISNVFFKCISHSVSFGLSLVCFLSLCLSLSVESYTDLTPLHSCTFASLFPVLLYPFQRTRVGSSCATK